MTTDIGDRLNFEDRMTLVDKIVEKVLILAFFYYVVINPLITLYILWRLI